MTASSVSCASDSTSSFLVAMRPKLYPIRFHTMISTMQISQGYAALRCISPRATVNAVSINFASTNIHRTVTTLPNTFWNTTNMVQNGWHSKGSFSRYRQSYF